MAVQQTRTIALISAGLSYLEVYDELAREYLRLNSAINNGQLSMAAAWSELGTLIPYLHPAPTHAITLQVEHEHYKRYARVNDRQRKRAELKRRAAGIQARPQRDPLQRDTVFNTIIPPSGSEELTEADVRRMAEDLGLTTDD